MVTAVSAKVIYDVYKKGCIYDAWTEFFNYEAWMETMEENGLDYHSTQQEKENLTKSSRGISLTLV